MAYRRSFNSDDERGRGGRELLDANHAFVLALRWLAGRDLSVQQIRDRLRRRGCDQAVIDETIQRLTRDGVADDRRAATSLARTARDVKRHGPHRVARDLESRGIPRELAREVVKDIFADADEDALIRRALDRRLRGPIDSPAAFRRLYQYLARLGFPSALIVRTLKARAKDA